jgi:nucleoside-diphosphate-sugar epimerase
MSSAIFITGAGGKTGLALLELMLESGASYADVTCFCRGERCRESLARFPVRIVYGDASDPGSLGSAYGGEETVIHLTSIFHAPAMLEACRGARHLIVVSSTGVYSEHRSGSTQIEEIERLVRYSGIPSTIIRPTMIYGTPDDRNISRLVRFIDRCRVVPLPGSGRARFQPVHVTDLARCILACLSSDASIGKNYNVPGGSAHSLAEIVRIIAGLMGRRVLIVPVPLSLASLAVRLLRSRIDPEQIERLREDKTFSYDEAARDLGYSPMTFEEGLRLQLEAMGLMTGIG